MTTSRCAASSVHVGPHTDVFFQSASEQPIDSLRRRLPVVCSCDRGWEGRAEPDPQGGETTGQVLTVPADARRLSSSFHRSLRILPMARSRKRPRCSTRRQPSSSTWTRASTRRPRLSRRRAAARLSFRAATTTSRPRCMRTANILASPSRCAIGWPLSWVVCPPGSAAPSAAGSMPPAALRPRARRSQLVIHL